MQVFAAAEAVTLSTTGAWTEVDLTGAPYSVPTTATFALLHVVLTKTGAGIQGFWVRSAASAESNVGGSGGTATNKTETHSIVVPLSAGKFDYYSTHNNVTAAVIGYFSALDGLAFNEGIDITPADPGMPSRHPLMNGWATVNVSAYVPSTFNLAVCSYHDTVLDSTQKHGFNIRKTGTTELIASTDYISEDSTPSGPCYRQYFLAPLTASGDFDIYGNYARTDVSQTRTLIIHGYLKAAENAAPTTTDAYTQPATSSTFIDRTNSTSARAVLVHMRGPSGGINPYAGFRMDGETGAHTTAMAATLMQGMKQAVVPLSVADAWEQYIQYSGSWSGKSAYTPMYFLSEELVSESITVTDTLAQDLYTREISESAAITDTLTVGDTHNPDTITESESITDALVADMARGAVVSESAAAADTILGVLERASASGSLLIDFLIFDGDGLTGYNAEDSLYLGTSLSATGLWGALGTNTALSTAAIVTASGGLYGNLSSGAATLVAPTSILGTGAHGNIGEATAYVAIKTEYMAANPTGFIATDGNNYVYIDITSTSLGGGYSGSGTLYLPVILYSDIVNRTGFRLNESTWSVYPVNIPLAAASRYNRQYASYSVASGKSYAVIGGNIYRIGERTDAGTAIGSIIAKSGIDAGSGHRKIATDIFLRLMSEGNFTVNVSADRGSGQITIVDNLQRKHGSKGDLPKGVIGREFAFNIHNVDGAYFEIDEIELIMALSEGRRGRQTSG